MKLRFKKILCILASAAFCVHFYPVYASGDMKVSEDCIELIKTAEGFSRYKYWDYSQWTIGYGTGVSADEYPDGITEAEAEELLYDAVVRYEGYVNNFADRYDVSLKQNQFDALVSLTYNMGNIWSAYDTFDLKTYVINGSENYSFLDIAKGFGEWRVAGGSVIQGLVTRRQEETKLFLSDREDYSG
ncbi:MAG: lysozyme, partial [Oscillospiraceae bacterium]|nr:lysozyme [Oscillospiraceae bacterium]